MVQRVSEGADLRSSDWEDDTACAVDERSSTDELRPVRELEIVPSLQPQTFGSVVRLGAEVARERIRDVRGGLDRAAMLQAVRQGLAVTGVLFLVLAAFLSVVGGMTERRDQRDLRSRYDEILESKSGFALVSQGREIPPGTPVGTIEIPKLGVNRVVVEGTTADDLRQGPGHLRATPLPGQHGNAVIAGRRTTYGGPFRDLHELQPRDEIITTTPFGRFTYEVAETTRLRSGDPDRLGPSKRDVLTLTTSDPVYRATKRLVVIAELRSPRSAFPDPLRPAQVPPVEATFFGNAGALWGAIGWEIVIFGVLIVARVLYRRWNKWPTYLLTTPIVIAVTFAWLERMAALLPSTL